MNAWEPNYRATPRRGSTFIDTWLDSVIAQNLVRQLPYPPKLLDTQFAKSMNQESTIGENLRRLGYGC